MNISHSILLPLLAIYFLSPADGSTRWVWPSEAPITSVQEITPENCTDDSPSYLIPPRSADLVEKAVAKAAKKNVAIDTKVRIEYDADGIPTNVSLTKSTGIDSVDKLIIAWAKQVRFNKSPCQSSRFGFIPVKST